MRILVAMDSFKGTLSAAEACEAVAAGLQRGSAAIEIVTMPLADGGAGTVDAVLRECGGERRTCRATGPLGEPVEAAWGALPGGEAAVVEMAAASGIALVRREKLNPMRATSLGTGEVLASAIGAGARTIHFGIGDTATVDGGLGAAQALGARFLRGDGSEILRPFTGANLIEVAGVDLEALEKKLRGVEIDVLCDVRNPLLGAQGAAAVFGPQKGATPVMVEDLERGLANAFGVIELATGRGVRDEPGAGAAGGMGAAARALFNARLVAGTERLFALLGFERALRAADVLITGEGRLDAQSLAGKGAGRALSEATRRGVHAWAISGIPAAGFDPRTSFDVEKFAVLSADGSCLGARESRRRIDEIAARWASAIR